MLWNTNWKTPRAPSPNSKDDEMAVRYAKERLNCWDRARSGRCSSAGANDRAGGKDHIAMRRDNRRALEWQPSIGTRSSGICQIIANTQTAQATIRSISRDKDFLGEIEGRSRWLGSRQQPEWDSGAHLWRSVMGRAAGSDGAGVIPLAKR